MEQSPLLDDYILNQSVDNPKVCFLGTASGDNEAYIARFYRRFSQAGCQPTHQELFRRDGRDLETFLLSQNIIYVGGGNTANMLAIWQLHRVDKILRKAYEAGVVLCGLSAGSICWFEAGVTDSFGGDLAAYPCLGLLKGSHCPHYDGESERRPAYHRLIQNGAMVGGVAADDGAALHYINGELHQIVASRGGAGAYRVGVSGQEVIEVPLEVERLN
ncbi:peptidase E [Parendozoicomonas haliclonae]|uniref:Peptidase family S51 n=2 Tax=Parendozoicomonas haliclonae TaxID=1960125 RepID=A0A1X7AFT9_9GAMM|nr:Peptidase family S51 [Parendozoicomonas haliclonae]